MRLSSQIHVSELVKRLLKRPTKPVRRKNIFELADRLEKPSFDPNADLKELFYKEQGEK
jgi:hypothetical protein